MGHSYSMHVHTIKLGTPLLIFQINPQKILMHIILYSSLVAIHFNSSAFIRMRIVHETTLIRMYIKQLYIKCDTMYHSLQYVAMNSNSRDRYKIIGLCDIPHFIKQLCRNFCLEKKSVINASKLLKKCSTLAKQSEKSNISIHSKLLKFQALPKFCQAACQPACLP